MGRLRLSHRFSFAFFVAIFLMTGSSLWAQYWTTFDNNTRYMALGDSLSSGYGAHPITQGFTYQLYGSGVIDKADNTLFCNASVPGSLSEDVLNYQVPQVERFFSSTGQTYRKIITLTVGGNDMMQILSGADANAVINYYGSNLYTILAALAMKYPDVRIYVANQYDPELQVPGEDILVAAVNDITAGIVGMFPDNAVLVDVFSVFQGRSGLLLNERQGAEIYQIHPTNAGYNAMEKAFERAMR